MATESDQTDMKARMNHRDFPNFGVLSQISERSRFINRFLRGDE
jgi:hypothetical protein